MQNNDLISFEIGSTYGEAMPDFKRPIWYAVHLGSLRDDSETCVCELAPSDLPGKQRRVIARLPSFLGAASLVDLFNRQYDRTDTEQALIDEWNTDANRILAALDICAVLDHQYQMQECVRGLNRRR